MMFSLKRVIASCLIAFPLLANAAEPLDINLATAEQLSLVLSGVGSSKANAIVAYREANGPFASIEQLTEVKGIGPALLQKNRDLIQVDEQVEGQ